MALQKFPGFIDIHVHLRDPGATQKEDFATGSRAAAAGGFTCVLDMPNNPTRPTTSPGRLAEKISLADKKAICDVGFHYATDGKNLSTFPSAWANPQVFGLKIYCNHTTGELLVEDEGMLDRIFSAWESAKPILVHAEGTQLSVCLALAKHYGRRLHVCHISEIMALEEVRMAKESGQQVTAGVTPHHLFLKKEHLEKLGPFGLVKPPIGDEQTREALWESLKSGGIDVVESDHAPHTRDDKLRSAPAYGVPGLETTIGLLMHAFVDGRLTLQQIISVLYENPKKIFSIPDQPDTFVELDPDKSYVVGRDGYQTKCGWSPFDGWELSGKVEHVVLRGRSLVEGGKIL